MKISQVKSIVHDLLNLDDWKNPLSHVWIKNKFEFDLISGNANYSEKDSLHDFCRGKREWFLKRVKSLKGDLKDFDYAKISIFGAKEKVEISYKSKKFEQDGIYDNAEIEKSAEELKEGIKNMKNVKVKLK